MQRKYKILSAILAVALLIAAVVIYPEYMRRSNAFYACARQSKIIISELASKGDKYFSENDFLFADRGASNAEPDETRGYRAIVVYDIGYTAERVVIRCYVNDGIVSDLKILGKANPK